MPFPEADPAFTGLRALAPARGTSAAAAAAAGADALPEGGCNDVVLLDATQRNADRRDAGLLDDGALATLNHLLVEALAVAFAFENHDDRERNLPAMDLGDEDAVAPPLTRAAADLLEDPDLF